jgi:Xaa-Pro aminopeptidase
MNIPATKPTIPVKEYHARWQQVQAMMNEQQLDLLAAYADDRAVFGPAHARWLANFPVHFESVCIFMPKQGEPVLLCGPESDEYARLIGQIPDVRVLREFTHPDEDYPYSTIQGLVEIASEVVDDLQSIRKVGLAGRGLMGVDSLSAFQAALPDAIWVDVENAVCDLRAQKSPAEIEVIRYAYHIAEIGISAAVDAIQPGVTERTVAAEAEAAMRWAGLKGRGLIQLSLQVLIPDPFWPVQPSGGFKPMNWYCSPSLLAMKGIMGQLAGWCWLAIPAKR